MATKTYVLLSNMDADAPVFQQTPQGRQKVTKIPFHRPTLRQQFYKDGKSVVIRYKSHASTIFQDKQMEDDKIPANEPFSANEYTDLKFRHAVLVTNKLMAQNYLEAHPEFEGFTGECDDVREPKYKLIDKEADAKVKNSDIRLRAKALNKVLNLELEELQAMLIRLNGSFFITPDDKADCENLLVEFIDDAEEAGLNAILEDGDKMSIDDKTTVLIGKLLNAGTLSFDAIPDKVAKKDKAGKWVSVIDMGSEYEADEKKRLFAEFLNTKEGELLKGDLENDLSSVSKKSKKQ
jgi:hypothetical protein